MTRELLFFRGAGRMPTRAPEVSAVRYVAADGSYGNIGEILLFSPDGIGGGGGGRRRRGRLEPRRGRRRQRRGLRAAGVPGACLPRKGFLPAG